MRQARLTVSLLSVLVVSCATATPVIVDDSEQSEATTGRRGGTGPITESDLADPAVAGKSLLEAIQILRPAFLRTRGQQGIDPLTTRVMVCIDDGVVGPLNVLAAMRTNDATEVRYLSASDAMQRFGARDVAGPVLLVTSRMR